MSKELDEIKGSLLEIIWDVVEWARDEFAERGIDPEDAVDRILSLSSTTCQIAVVRKEGELPVFNPPSHIIGSPVETVSYQWHRKTQGDMLKVGYVQRR